MSCSMLTGFRVGNLEAKQAKYVRVLASMLAAAGGKRGKLRASRDPVNEEQKAKELLSVQHEYGGSLWTVAGRVASTTKNTP